MRNAFSFLQRIDWMLCIAISVLVIIGNLTQYSLSIEPEIFFSDKMIRQLVYIALAIIVFIVCSIMNYRALITSPWVSVVIMILLLLAVIFFGTELKGATGWIIIGPLSVQPVEFVKALCIIYLATVMRKYGEYNRTLAYSTILTTGATIFVVLLLVLQQPDLGSASIVGAIWFGFLILAKAPKHVVFILVIGVIAASIFGWFFIFQDYQKDRLSIFLNRESDPLGKGYNITQSIIAVGSGGMWGKGFAEGTQSQLQFLPEASSDFAFAVVAEEFGFVGASIVILALLLICWRLYVIMQTSNDRFVFFFSAGVALYILTQSMVVIGMNIGIMPITGLPLPFISSGGSSLLATSIMLGVAHSMYMHR